MSTAALKAASAALLALLSACGGGEPEPDESRSERPRAVCAHNPEACR